MNKWTGQVAVVTGASSGIGRGVAVRLANEGLIVAALARRKDKLDELVSTVKGKGKIKAYKCDVSDLSQVEEVFNKITAELGPVKVLVNNAGVAMYSPLLDFKFEEWRKMFDINFFGLLHCTKQLVECHKKNPKQQAHVININRTSSGPTKRPVYR